MTRRAADAAVTSPGPASAHAAVRRPDIITRAEWGADESLRNGFAGYSDTIVAGVVHHTATSSDYAPEDSPGIVRSIYAYHTRDPKEGGRAWADIGYNFLVDAPAADLSGVTDAGAVFAVPGGAGGVEPANTDVFTQADAGVPGSPERGDAFGAAVAMGQVDGRHGYDVAVGAPREDIRGRTRAGMIVLLYANTSGLAGTGAKGRSQRSPGVAGAPEPYDHFGDSLAAADLDADGLADITVSVAHEDLRGARDSGAVAVFRGAPDGLGHDEFWSQRTPGVPGVSEAQDEFGSSLRLGNYDGGATVDLAAGVPGENRARGSVRVLFGGSSLLGSAGAMAVSQRKPGVPGAAERGDRAGE